MDINFTKKKANLFGLPNIEFNENFINTESNNTKKYSRELVFFGVPCDVGSSIPGCRFGPEILREYSYKHYNINEENIMISLEGGYRNFPNIPLYDLGDINCSSYEEYHSVLFKYASLLPANKIPFMLGGDHSFTYSMIRGISQNQSELLLVHIDQHLDIELWGTFTEDMGPKELSPLCHGNFISWLKKDIEDINILQIGMFPYHMISKNTIGKVLNYLKYVSKKIDSKQIGEMSFNELAGVLPKGQKIYLSIDIDVLCSNFIKHTGYPSSLGLSVQILIYIIKFILSNNHIIGIDLMEFGSHLIKEDERETHIVIFIILEILNYLKG